MRTFGNVVWLLFGGFFIVAGYLLGGVVLCVTIVGIPFGVQAFKLARAVAMPFGTDVIETDRSSGCLSVILNVLWILLPGIELAFLHLILAAAFAVTIVGIPIAVRHVELVPLALMPFGRDLVRR